MKTLILLLVWALGPGRTWAILGAVRHWQGLKYRRAL